MPAGAVVPDLPTFHIAKVYAALAGSPWADAAQRKAVAGDAHPGARAARERMRSARQYHAAQAVKAVTRGVRGIVFGACGFPAEPEPHTAAAAAAPDARFVFAAHDADIAKISEALFGECGRIGVCTASVRDPEGLLGCTEIAALPRPLHVQVQLALHFWPPDFARSLIRDYMRLLPRRSELLLSWTLPSDTDGGRKLAQTASGIARAQVYRHPATDVAAWLDDAGLRVIPPGPADVRGWVPRWAERERAKAPGRAMGVVARKR